MYYFPIGKLVQLLKYCYSLNPNIAHRACISIITQTFALVFLTIKIRLFKGHPVGDLKATGQDGSATLLDAIKLHFKL